MASSSSAAAAPSSTLSPHAAPYTLRARPVFAPPGRQQDGDASRLTDDNLMMPAAYYFAMKSWDAVYPASAHGMHQSQPSSSSGIHVDVYASSASSTSAYKWMASELKQEQLPLTSGKGGSRNKSTKVTIKCPPSRSLETNNSFGSKSKLAKRENDDCNNEAGKDISCRNLEFSSPGNDSGSSQGALELNPVLKPICIPSKCTSSRVSVADDVNLDPSECSVDSPCWPGALAFGVSALDVLQTSDAPSVKQKMVDFSAGRGSTFQDCEASTEIENLVGNKSRQNHSQYHVELGLSKNPEDVDKNLKNDSHGKALEHAEHGVGKYNAEHTYCLEAINNCMKRSSLNSAAPDFIPSTVRESSSGNGLPSSIIPHSSYSSTGRNTSEILKSIQNLLGVLQNSYFDDIELEEYDLSLLLSIIENLQSYLYKARKGPVNGASDKAGRKACHSKNAVSKSVSANQNGIYNADKGKGTIISAIADYSHSLDDVGRNRLTGYQPAPNNFRKELSYEDERSQVIIFKNLWIDAVRTNCALKYQLEQTRMAIDLQSSMAHNGDGPRNPSFQLCDMVTSPSGSVGLALTCPPMLKGHAGVRNTPNPIYVGNGIHSGDNNVLSRSKDSVLKNIKAERFMSELGEYGIRRGLQLVPNNSQGVELEHSDGISSHSYITRRDDILPASCEFRLSDWEHVLKDEIV